MTTRGGLEASNEKRICAFAMRFWNSANASGNGTRADGIRETAEAAEKLQKALDLKERREQEALMRQLGFGRLVDYDR